MDLSIYQGHSEDAELCRMTDAGTGDLITPEAFGTYCQRSMEKSAEETGSQDVLFLSVEKESGPADVAILGNGPTSGKNGLLFRDAPPDPGARQAARAPGGRARGGAGWRAAGHRVRWPTRPGVWPLRRV